MIRLSYVFIGLLLLSVACSKSEKETPNGFKYTVVKAGNGELPKKGEILVFDFQLKDSKDSVWNDSYKDGIPAAIEIKDTSELKQEDGITQMLRMLAPGDSVKTTMTIPDFFKNLVRRPIPPTIDSTKSVTYTMNARDVMTIEEFLKWRPTMVKDRDEKQITKYLADNKIKAEKDTSGIYYVIYNHTGGPNPTPENCVEVKYAGKFLKTGLVFDKNEKIAFSLNQVIAGWKQAIPMLAKGDSGTFFIPSRLAYGDRGYYGIPPDAVLMFDVTLIDFKNTVDQATNSCK
jgi:FKBP-type peptidyl-prolyl cis-trans isomerase FkpA